MKVASVRADFFLFLQKQNFRLLQQPMLNKQSISAGGWDVAVAESAKGVPFFKNAIVRWLFSINVLFLSASFLILGYFIRPSENLFILHYNVYFGVEIQGIWWQAFIPPLTGVLFFFGHLIFARRFYRKSERIASYLMLFGSWLISVGILVASAGIAFINY